MFAQNRLFASIQPNGMIPIADAPIKRLSFGPIDFTLVGELSDDFS